MGGLNPLIVIPARMASTRLPRKPLADIGGQPMIVHVWRRAMESGLGPVIVAAAEREIVEAVQAAGGEAVLTRPDLPSGSDRVFEAIEKVDADHRFNVVVNVQGDLPDLDPALPRLAAALLEDDAVDCGTLAAPIRDEGERTDPHVVKAVVATPPDAESPGQGGRALYFSRATVPTGDGPLYHHIGLYAWRRHSLSRFVNLPPSPLEQRERLEQLRALETGMRIDVAFVDTPPVGVDTPADLARARTRLAGSSGFSTR